MIKFPECKQNESGANTPLKVAVNASTVALGQRYMIENNPVTCVDIDNNKYIFSMDEIYKCGSHNDIIPMLHKIYETGKIDGIKVLPTSIMKDIDFLFIPSTYQIFGKNKYSIEEKDVKQFEWYKRGNLVRIKGYNGIPSDHWDKNEICHWWLSNVSSSYNFTYCQYYYCVSYEGSIIYNHESNIYIGIPIFFQITKKE